MGKHYFQTKTTVEDNDVRDMLARLYNLEFMETGLADRKSETSMSREDHKFMKILQEGTKLRNGHYQVPLPFKDPCIDLPNNRHQYCLISVQIAREDVSIESCYLDQTLQTK